eukprot:TRINITY_DN74922_c0_g1_i1.p1 TRINITY_DN74922_c0_g1~~TRINITY_DN74922_c0_g1_i1.p1  ORF type:complete len:1195 (+),score=218.26 TRINITY_DN74922_c0_g1_i1:171-3755(+)
MEQAPSGEAAPGAAIPDDACQCDGTTNPEAETAAGSPNPQYTGDAVSMHSVDTPTPAMNTPSILPSTPTHSDRDVPQLQIDAERAHAIVESLVTLLRTPVGMSQADAEGYVPIYNAIGMSSDLTKFCGRSMAAVVKAVEVASPLWGPVALNSPVPSLQQQQPLINMRYTDENASEQSSEVSSDLGAGGRSVRLRTTEDRAAAALKAYMEVRACGTEVNLDQILADNRMQVILRDISSDRERRQILRRLVDTRMHDLRRRGREITKQRPNWHEMEDNTSSGSDTDDCQKRAMQLCDHFTQAPTGLTACTSTPGGQMKYSQDWFSDVYGVQHVPTPPGVEVAEFERNLHEWYDRRYHNIRAVIDGLLRDPPPQLSFKMKEDGSVRVDDLLHSSHHLASLARNGSDIWKALQNTDSLCGMVVVDKHRGLVRLLPLAEQLCQVIEDVVMQQDDPYRVIPFASLVDFPEIKAAFARSRSFGDGNSVLDRMVCLRTAASHSGLLSVVEIEQDGVRCKPQHHLLREVSEEILSTDKVALTRLQNDGEVALAWLKQHAQMRKLLYRLKEGGDSITEMLAYGLDNSKDYALDGARLSVRLRHRAEDRDDIAEFLDVWRESAKTPTSNIKPKDVKAFRELVTFYFSAFNLQHNRVLMALIEAHYEKSAAFPTFRLCDLRALPRIDRMLRQYEERCHRALVTAALQGTGMPLRILSNVVSDANMMLQFTHHPNVRFLKARDPNSSLVVALAAPTEHPQSGKQHGSLPDNAIAVVSYSISSDLSHESCPKAAEAMKGINDGLLEMNVIEWDSRRKKLLRQLKTYSPDIICIQALQTMGQENRCSETDSQWFSSDEHTSDNHLVDLYRDLSPDNYGVFFTRTLDGPCDKLVFGNAVFWQRSKWIMSADKDLSEGWACGVRLRHKHTGAQLKVFSVKPPFVYAEEWDEKVSADQARTPAEFILNMVRKKSLEDGIAAICCGDFGTAPLGDLLEAREEEVLRPASALLAAPGSPAPRTVVGIGTRDGAAADAIIHSSDLVCEAVLDGLYNSVTVIDHLRTGFPSDHLLQFAVFSEKSSLSSSHRPYDAADSAEGNDGDGAEYATHNGKSHRQNKRRHLRSEKLTTTSQGSTTRQSNLPEKQKRRQQQQQDHQHQGKGQHTGASHDRKSSNQQEPLGEMQRPAGKPWGNQGKAARGSACKRTTTTKYTLR